MLIFNEPLINEYYEYKTNIILSRNKLKIVCLYIQIGDLIQY
jgi:hypothetical protein